MPEVPVLEYDTTQLQAIMRSYLGNKLTSVKIGNSVHDDWKVRRSKGGKLTSVILPDSVTSMWLKVMRSTYNQADFGGDSRLGDLDWGLCV